MKNLIWLALAIVSNVATAAALSPEEYLNKISERLTGRWATPFDYQKLEEVMAQTNCRQISCLSDFYRTYARAKLDTPEFYNEATLKVFEKFGFQTPTQRPMPITKYSNNDTDAREMLLPYRVFKEDLSLDTLFTGQVYWRRHNESDRYSMFRAAPIQWEKTPAESIIIGNLPELSQIQTQELDYTGHPNIAGLFSTNTFLTRYWNSPVNSNKKRAAAFYRIMLCNTMNPALERESMQEREEALSRGVPVLEASSRSIEEIHKNRHAHQADCAKCHNLLDPVSYTMRPMELGISKFASPGMLRVYNEFNRTEEYRVNSFAELVKKATELQPYQDCQVNWLFNWVVGKDVAVHPQRFMDLLESFKRNGRKAKTMVEELVLSPEFRGETTNYVEAASFTRANTVLKNCRDCHSNFFNTSADEMKAKLRKISRKLDLPNDGRGRQMPPIYHWWQPTDEEVLSIKSWVQEGAPLTQGRPVLTPSEVREILGTGAAQ